MKSMINLKNSTLIEMDPLSLQNLISNEIDLDLPKSIDSNKEKKEALNMMNKAISYVCYFKELETLARIMKRKAKRDKKDQNEVERLLSCEEIFETYKRISENIYTQISKMMTMKRLMLDETKLLGETT